MHTAYAIQKKTHTHITLLGILAAGLLLGLVDERHKLALLCEDLQEINQEWNIVMLAADVFSLKKCEWPVA